MTGLTKKTCRVLYFSVMHSLINDKWNHTPRKKFAKSRRKPTKMNIMRMGLDALEYTWKHVTIGNEKD
ncbi:MAG: hypothetical protein NPIRA02_04510 [Nitrospirales bacterium]|nr:MAG: hypothetical protein NPIRA02_04510 [Nitrospirales bacterium]